ncbi:MAG: DUF1223 domain-containing protein [Ahrensia sp.]|nr:DUF1223 domain-containing protein [Ahrensia sp.]
MTKYRHPRGIMIVAFALLASLFSAHAADKNPSAVIELFTSQGCSSCPPADKILSDYAKQDDVLALSWHVDYWNYLGWRDTFSDERFTDRQRRYAVSFARRGVYTPQAVVNGRNHVVGSRLADIEALRTAYQSSGKGLTVPLETQRIGKAVHISAKADAGDATLWIVYFDRQKQVQIERGENRGRTISYHNVVRDFSVLGMMTDGQVDVTLPLAELKKKGFDSCAILLQETTSSGTPGAIIGATVLQDMEG